MGNKEVKVSLFADDMKKIHTHKHPPTHTLEEST